MKQLKFIYHPIPVMIESIGTPKQQTVGGGILKATQRFVYTGAALAKPVTIKIVNFECSCFHKNLGYSLN